MAIGYEPSLVKVAPTTFKSLLKGPYWNQVAIDGDPTLTRSAFAAVYAAALANGGSLANIAAGVNYFRGLKPGNFVQVRGTVGTMLSGPDPDPDLVGLPAELPGEAGGEEPEDRHSAGRRVRELLQPGDQRVGAAPRPPPGCGRSSFYSAEGQNLFLEGSVRPIELRSLLAAGMIDAPAYQMLPKVPAGAVYQLPSAAELASADTVVAKLWPSVTG